MHALTTNKHFLSRFITAAPTLFREGDIVEIQSTIVAVPVKDDQVKLILQLRSIALLDSSFSKVRFHYILYYRHIFRIYSQRKAF